MGFLRPEVQAQQVRSQATPLAEDVLENLRRQLRGGVYGEGVGPLQREAGTAIRQFMAARETPERFESLAQPMIDISRRETDRGAAQLRENLGTAGLRLGTPATQAEGRFRAEAGQNLDSLLAQLFSQEQANLLQSIGMLQSMGVSNIAPFLQMAGLGIIPDQTIVTDSPWVIGAETAAGLMEGLGSLLGGLKRPGV